MDFQRHKEKSGRASAFGRWGRADDAHKLSSILVKIVYRHGGGLWPPSRCCQ
jgi:hypothetical protein